MGLFEAGSEKSRPALVINASSFSSSYPDHIIVVGADAIDMIIQERGGISDCIPVNAERVSVVPVQTVIGSEPHEAIVVSVNTGDGIVRKALINPQISYG
jgi:hypothetical protein